MPNLDPNGLLFNTVKTFVEQIGRRKQWRYGELDTLVCTWNGPASDALTFKPQVNSPHPDYPLMFCTDSEIVNQVAQIAEIQATYNGIISTSGTKSYISPPIVSISPVQGSRDFVTPYSYASGTTSTQDSSGNTVTTATFTAGTRTLTVRYIGTQCSIRYQSYPAPKGLHYAALGLENVQWTVLSQTQGGFQTALSGATFDQVQAFLQSIAQVPPLFASYLGFEAEQRGNWYNCTEIYGPTF